MRYRTSMLRADLVKPGMSLRWWYIEEGRPLEVLRSFEGPDGQWRLTWDGGGFKNTPDTLVPVLDESGLIGLQHDLEVYGPFVCASGETDSETAGTIHFHNIRLSGGPVVGDLIIRRNDETIAVLEHIELGHIQSMCARLIDSARSDPGTPRYHSKRFGGCGKYHPAGVVCSSDH